MERKHHLGAGCCVHGFYHILKHYLFTLYFLHHFSRASHRNNGHILAPYQFLVLKVSYILLAYSQYVENNGLNISFPTKLLSYIYST